MSVPTPSGVVPRLDHDVRPDLPSPPSRERLAAARLHELIRDFPEVLALVRELGLDPGEAGGRPLPESVHDPDGALDRIARVLSWRAEASGGEEDRRRGDG